MKFQFRKKSVLRLNPYVFECFWSYIWTNVLNYEQFLALQCIPLILFSPLKKIVKTQIQPVNEQAFLMDQVVRSTTLDIVPPTPCMKNDWIMKFPFVIGQ